jgi:hypothetical protein
LEGAKDTTQHRREGQQEGLNSTMKGNSTTRPGKDNETTAKEQQRKKKEEK